MLTALIVDDETDARRVLRKLIGMYCPEVSTCLEAADLPMAKKALDKHSFDLLFLDIHLHAGTEGLELARQLTNFSGRIVFVTAHDEHAVEAFKTPASDFLLKPVDPLELQRIVQEESRNRKNATPMLHNLLLSDRRQMLLIPEEDIIHVKGEGSYCTLYVSDREPVTISRNLATLERQLKSNHFLRVHQSHLIHLRKIRSIDRTDGFLLKLSNGEQVPVARRRKDELLSRLKA
ncbi:MAG: LytTR family DNA-binding domain-containing protein [Bacteroidota bacterium]